MPVVNTWGPVNSWQSVTAATITAVSSPRGAAIAAADDTLTITVDDSSGISSVTINGVAATAVTIVDATTVTATAPHGFNAAYGATGDVVVNNGVADSAGYTVTLMPPTGMIETAFTVDYASLDPASPFAGDSAFAAIVAGDSCIYDAQTTPDGLQVTMDGAGKFTTSAEPTTNQSFDYFIWDASDLSSGPTGTISVEGTGAQPSLPVITAVLSANDASKIYLRKDIILLVDDSTSVTQVQVNGQDCSNVQPLDSTHIQATLPTNVGAYYGQAIPVRCYNGQWSAEVHSIFAPPYGWKYITLTVDAAGLSAESPLYNNPTYSGLVSGDQVAWGAGSVDGSLLDCTTDGRFYGEVTTKTQTAPFHVLTRTTGAISSDDTVDFSGLPSVTEIVYRGGGVSWRKRRQRVLRTIQNNLSRAHRSTRRGRKRSKSKWLGEFDETV